MTNKLILTEVKQTDSNWHIIAYVVKPDDALAHALTNNAMSTPLEIPEYNKAIFNKLETVHIMDSQSVLTHIASVLIHFAPKITWGITLHEEHYLWQLTLNGLFILNGSIESYSRAAPVQDTYRGNNNLTMLVHYILVDFHRTLGELLTGIKPGSLYDDFPHKPLY